MLQTSAISSCFQKVSVCSFIKCSINITPWLWMNFIDMSCSLLYLIKSFERQTLLLIVNELIPPCPNLSPTLHRLGQGWGKVLGKVRARSGQASCEPNVFYSYHSPKSTSGDRGIDKEIVIKRLISDTGRR